MSFKVKLCGEFHVRFFRILALRLKGLNGSVNFGGFKVANDGLRRFKSLDHFLVVAPALGWGPRADLFA